MKTWFDAFRENTGKALCDSGDAYGRHWQKPPLDPDKPVAVITLWRNEISATISTAHFLNELMEIDQEMCAAFEEWAALDEHARMDWFEAGQAFLVERGYVTQCRDNIYNGENDLSQVYVWEVWGKEDSMHEDWLYWSDDKITVIYPHNGCDVRGGYASPVFCRPRHKHEYSIPVDVVCGFSILEARHDGETISDSDRWNLDEKWQVGYSSNPAYAMNKEIERVFRWTLSKDEQTVCAKLSDGTLVKIGVTPPC